MKPANFATRPGRAASEELHELRKEQFNLRMQRGTGQLAQHTT
jgi:ribosomal protein L29